MEFKLSRREFGAATAPITDKIAKELCRVLHYSESREMKAMTQILVGVEAV